MLPLRAPQQLRSVCTLQQCPQTPTPHSPATKHTELPTAPHMLQPNTPPVITAHAGSTHLTTSHAPLVISTQANSAIWHKFYIGPHIHIVYVCMYTCLTLSMHHTHCENTPHKWHSLHRMRRLGAEAFSYFRRTQTHLRLPRQYSRGPLPISFPTKYSPTPARLHPCFLKGLAPGFYSILKAIQLRVHARQCTGIPVWWTRRLSNTKAAKFME